MKNKSAAARLRKEKNALLANKPFYVNTAWLKRWHSAVIRECGTDDLCTLIAHKEAFEAVKNIRKACETMTRLSR